METNLKKTIDNHLFLHKCVVEVEEDDYAIIERYGSWAKINEDEAIKAIFNYALRIIKNILKYHKNYDNLESLIEVISNEAKIDLKLIKNHKQLYKSLYQECYQHCVNRHQYTPYERSYWFDILLTLMKYQEQAKRIQPVLN
ncbi:MAG: hypothetical protein L3I91_00555 [Mycoplasma sp.]